eukprot:gene23103-29933_t
MPKRVRHDQLLTEDAVSSSENFSDDLEAEDKKERGKRILNILFPDGKERELNFTFLQAVLDYYERHNSLPVDQSATTNLASSKPSIEDFAIINTREPLVFGNGILTGEGESICDAANVFESFDGAEFGGGEVASDSDIVYADTASPTVSNPYACDRAVQEDGGNVLDIDINSSDHMYMSLKEDEADGDGSDDSKYEYGDEKEAFQDDQEDSNVGSSVVITDMEIDQAAIEVGDGTMQLDIDNCSSSRIHSPGNGPQDHDEYFDNGNTNTLETLPHNEEDAEEVEEASGDGIDDEHNDANLVASSSSSSSSSSSLPPYNIREYDKLLQKMHCQLDKNLYRQSLPVVRGLLAALKVKNNYSKQKKLALLNSGLLRKLRHWLRKAYEGSPEQKILLKVLALATSDSNTFEYCELLQDGKESCDVALLDNLQRLLSEAIVDQESRHQVLCILSHLVMNGKMRAQRLLCEEFNLPDILLPLDRKRNNHHCLDSALFLMNNLRLDLEEAIATASDPMPFKEELTRFAEKLVPEAAAVLKRPQWLLTITHNVQTLRILYEASILLDAFTDIPDHFIRSHNDRVAMVQACNVVPALLKIDKKIAEKLKCSDSLSGDLLEQMEKVETPVLFLLRNLTSGSDETSEKVIRSGGQALLAMLSARVCDDEPKIRSSSCNMANNIAAGSASQCRYVARSAEVVSALLSTLEECPQEDDQDHCDAWRFAAEALLHIVSNGEPSDYFKLCQAMDRRLVKAICQQVLAFPERELELIPIALEAMESSVDRLSDDSQKKRAMWNMWRDEGALALLDRLSQDEDADTSEGAKKTASFFSSCLEN